MTDFDRYRRLNERIAERMDSGNFAEAREAAEHKTELISQTKDHDVIADQWLNFSSTFYLSLVLQRDDLTERDLLDVVKHYSFNDTPQSDSIQQLILEHPASSDRVASAVNK
jgi:hypothetical protein